MTLASDLTNTLPEGKDTVQHLVIATLESKVRELEEQLAVYRKMHRHPTIAICGIDSTLHWVPLREERIAKIISEAKNHGGTPRLT